MAGRPVQMFIWQAGGDVLNEAKTETTIDRPKPLQGINFYADIIYNPHMPRPKT